jgi:signal transduction histidine kinase
MPYSANNDPVRSAKNLKIGVAAIVAVMVLAMWAAVGVSLYLSREAVLADMKSDAANLALAFDDELTHSLDTIAKTMDAVANRMRAKGSDMNIYAWSREIPIKTGPIVEAGIVTPNGMLVSSTATPNMKPIDMSDREHVRIGLNGKYKGLFIGPPVLGRVGGQMVIPITKRVETEDGRFVGVLDFIVLPERLTALHKSIDLGDDGVIALIGTDDIIRTRFTKKHPDGLDGIGDTIPHSPDRDRVLETDHGSGSYIQPNTVDHVTRLISYRRIADYPLIVAVGLGYDEGLASWRVQAETLSALAAAVTLLLGGLALYLMREIGLRETSDLELVDEHRRLLAANIELADEHIRLQTANAELIESQTRAEDANRAKSHFLANMSHELRTPLNAILGFSQIIKDEVMGPVGKPVYADYAKDIHGAGDHLLKLINRVLDMAKIEAGKIELSDDVLDPAEIVRASMMEVRGQAADKGLALTVDIPPGTPFIRGDELRLSEVLINLLSNAVKFTEAGHIRVSAAFDETRGFSFTVADTGIGMSPSEIKEALEPFGQVDNAFTRKHQGTGLGLPLAQRLIELHGGRLAIESVKGSGTTIRVYLPLDRVVRPVSLVRPVSEAAA